MIEILCKDSKTGKPYRRLFHRADIVTVIEDEKTHDVYMQVRGVNRRGKACTYVIDLAESFDKLSAKLCDLWWQRSREQAHERANSFKKD